MTETNIFTDDATEEFQKQMAELQDAYNKKASKMFHNACKKLFEAVPALAEVRWPQYTPHFNDGDACKFRLSDINFISKFDAEGVDGDVDEIDDVNWGYNSFHAYDADIVAANIEEYGEEAVTKYADVCRHFDAFVNQLDSSMLEDMFGDHVMVRITPEEIIIDEFDHD
jgi:hypothetical protein